MKFLILFTLLFLIGMTYVSQDAFGIAGCDVPHCYALDQSIRTSPIDGIKYQLDSPDLYMKNSM